MFIDEAQDMGPNTLKLLTALVEQSDADDPKSRSVNIFYDNAQNIFGRSTPKWSEIGLDMRGRSTVMKESFRSTKPITEFALNVLYRLQPPQADPDHKELIERGMIERISRKAGNWWDVRFNQVDGPIPIFRKYPTLDKQIDALGDQIVRWIRDEGVRPRDISILYNGKNVAWRIQQDVAPKVEAVGGKVLVQTSQSFTKDDRTVLASTSHSFKGYDSEIVVIAGVEQFIAQGRGILANNLYVAMTRARSILAIFAYARANPNEQTKQLLSVIEECLNQIVERPVVEKEISNLDEFDEVLQRIGPDKRAWLERIWRTHRVEQEPILSSDGEILAEPLFWYKANERAFVCFGNEPPGAYFRQKLEDAGFEIISPGE